MRERIARAKEWYLLNERRVSSASLILGFVVDSLTLQRIDNPRENIWIALNLLVAGSCIVLLNKGKDPGLQNLQETRKHFWLTTILQFSFGALLGAFFIFYFRSATLSAAWPFLLLLLAAMAANEYLQKRYARLASQISFLYFSVLLFLIFLVPVLVHRIGAIVFLLSGLLSLALSWAYGRLLGRFAPERFRESKRTMGISVGAIFLLVNFLYFTNLIPPIPLSLKDAGIYHGISRTQDGYSAVDEDYGFWEYLHIRDRFDLSAGGRAYAYSAIFSPAALSTRIVHEWQYKDEESGEWVTSSRINLAVSGGRDEGFRTYSEKSNLVPGKWRVNVETPRGQLIGRINFEVVETGDPPRLRTEIKD